MPPTARSRIALLACSMVLATLPAYAHPSTRPARPAGVSTHPIDASRHDAIVARHSNLLGGLARGAVHLAVRTSPLRVARRIVRAPIESLALARQLVDTLDLSARLAPVLHAQAARSLVAPGRNADVADAALLAHELAKLPRPLLLRLQRQRFKVVAARGTITTHRADLAGELSEDGRPWEQVPGMAEDREAVVAVVGHDSDDGAHVPATHEAGNGCHNLVLHEVGHLVDTAYGKLSQSESFKQAYAADYKRLSLYEKQEDGIGEAEAFAEGFARHFDAFTRGSRPWPRVAKWFVAWEAEITGMPEPEVRAMRIAARAQATR